MENLSQYSRRNSDNASDPGSGTKLANLNNSVSSGLDQTPAHHNNSFQAPSNQVLKKPLNKKIDKKKVLPTKKFPELNLVANGEVRNQNSSLSSDEELTNVSPLTSNGAVPSH